MITPYISKLFFKHQTGCDHFWDACNPYQGKNLSEYKLKAWIFWSYAYNFDVYKHTFCGAWFSYACILASAEKVIERTVLYLTDWTEFYIQLMEQDGKVREGWSERKFVNNRINFFFLRPLESTVIICTSSPILYLHQSIPLRLPATLCLRPQFICLKLLPSLERSCDLCKLVQH